MSTVLCHKGSDLLKLIASHLKKRKLKPGETLQLRIDDPVYRWVRPTLPPPLEIKCLPISPGALDRLFAKPIEKLELNHPRYITALKKAGVVCIGQLVRMSGYGIGKVKGVGVKTDAQREVIKAVRDLGLECGMQIPVGVRELKVLRKVSFSYILWYVERTFTDPKVRFGSETRQELSRRGLRSLGDILDMRYRTVKAIFAKCKVQDLSKREKDPVRVGIKVFLDHNFHRHLWGFESVEGFLTRFCLSIGMNYSPTTT